MFSRENAFDAVLLPIAAQYGVDPALVKGIIGAESQFNPNAQGDAGVGGGSMGLMQVNFATAQGMGFTGQATDLLDPNLNIEFGTRVLVGALQQVGGDWGAAASVYNGGFRPTIGFGKPVPSDTTVALHAGGSRVVPAGQYFNQAYVNQVLRYAAYFQGQAPPPDASAPPEATSQSGDTNIGGAAVDGSLALTLAILAAAVALAYTSVTRKRTSRRAA